MKTETPVNDVLIWLRDEKRIYDTSPLKLTGVELARYIVQYTNYIKNGK